MTDTTATPAATAEPDIRARNKEILFAALAEAGIHCVTIDYDGSGDSGQIENVEAWSAANERLPFPTECRIQLASDNPDLPYAEQNLEATNCEGGEPSPIRTITPSPR